MINIYYKPKPLIKKLCKVCNKEFKTARLRHIYCSDECRYKNTREKVVIANITKKKKKCKYCGNEFTWISSRKNQIYCSQKCQKEFYKKEYEEKIKGIFIHSGKISNYYRLRFEIFKRDNFTCQYCGRNVKEDKIKLHCDHIIPRKKGGLYVDKNLITSCEECNLGKSDVLLEDRKLKPHRTLNLGDRRENNIIIQKECKNGL